MKKTVLATAISVALVGCGGGGGGTTSTPLTSTAVSGAAAKGIMIRADVVVRNAATNEVLVDNIQTDVKGKYSATLPAGFTGEVRVEVSSNADTLMVCDLTTCGTGTELDKTGVTAVVDVDGGDPDGTIEFKEVYKPGEGLTLKVLTTVRTGTTAVTSNATPLTTMAANYAEANGVSAAEANATVAAQAGLTTYALDSLPVVDITDPTAVAEASPDAINAAVTSAALVEASGGIDKFAAATSYDTVYSTTSPLDLSTAATNLNKAAGANAVVDNTVEEITIPTDIDLDALAKVQAFVAQVRDFEVYSNRVDQNVAAFETEIATITANIGEEAGSVLAEMTEVLGAITLAVDYVMSADQEVASFSGMEFNGGIPVNYNAPTGTFSVVGDGDVAAHNISATVTDNSYGTETQTDTGYTGSGTLDASIKVTGTSSTDTFELQVVNGSVSIKGTETYSGSESDSTTGQGVDWVYEETSNITSAAINLNVEMTQTTDSGDHSFTGAFNASLTGLDEAWTNSFTNEVDGYSYNETDKLNLDLGSIKLSGDFASADGNSVNASVALSLTNFSESNTSTDSWDSGSWSDTTSVDLAKATLTFGVDISGLTANDNQVNVTATLTAKGSESWEGTWGDTYKETSSSTMKFDADVNVKYDGSMLNFAFVPGTESSTGTLTNHNGVKLALAEDSAGVVTGTITYGAIEYATVAETDGVVKITYTYKGADGKFETL